jgi:tripartite-type tricarboxylate transporter receptor subunit TctC
MRKDTTVIMVKLAAAAVCSSAFAQSPAQPPDLFPSKPIRLIVPFAPGGGSEVGRVVMQTVSTSTGHQIVIDNRAGAGGVVGAEMAARAAPDGYTIFFGGSASHGTNPNLYARLPYHPVRDFSPITLFASTPYILTSNPALQVRTASELIALAKAKSGQLSYSSAGNGSTMHLTGEMFKTMAGVDILHVPYKGGGPAMIALLGNEVQVVFNPASVVGSNIKIGKLVALGVTSASRYKLFPDVPTIAESGVPGFQVESWYGILAPVGTPRAAILWLNREINKAMQSAAVLQNYESLGVEALGTTPEQFAEHIRRELAKWAKVIKTAGIRVE